MAETILGYTRHGVPITPVLPGCITTAALIVCSNKACGAVIRSNGGPSHDALCVPCWEKRSEQNRPT